MPAIDQMVKEFLAQERIAIAGVSRTREDAANLIYRKLKDTGHTVFAVNPNAEEFDGKPCYPDLKSIPGGVEAVVIVTRPEVSEKLVRECPGAGISQVWMHRSLEFIGSSVSDEATAFCRENGISVIPGGCPMMFVEPVDIGHKCMRWFLRATGRLPA